MNKDNNSPQTDPTTEIIHEIKTPLTAALLLSEYLVKKLKLEDFKKTEASQIAENIILALKRVNKIIAELQNQEYRLDQIIDPRELIWESVTLCQLVHQSLEQNPIRLIIDPLPQDLLMRCSPILISQVLINLLDNAKDAIKGLTERWIKVTLGSDDDSILIAITDSGQTIPLKTRNILFQPFFTTKGSQNHKGIGLSISKKTIEAHHGTLRLDTSSQATRFVIQIPRLILRS